MSNTTTCTRCGKLYEESSSEEANSPKRECVDCWKSLHNARNSAARAAFAGREVSELSSFRQRCEDLELMLRLSMDLCRGGSWISTEANGTHIVRWGKQDEDGIPQNSLTLQGDGTGLPLLTPEAREALRKR